ncbi:hypothetical protein T484DRAFT_1820857 [Baffinella frigidus]|jgi:hypothetical protein|nr:hypothetical protein T484DRAFT_1820857 [Cryptophyta sp. CCMP2293]
MYVWQPSEAIRDALSNTLTRFHPDLVVVKQMRTHIHQLRKDECVHAQRLVFLDTKIRELRARHPPKKDAPPNHDRKPELRRSTSDKALSLSSFRTGRLLSTMPASPNASSFPGGSFLGANLFGKFFGSRRLPASSSPVHGAQINDPDTEAETVDQYELHEWNRRDTTLDYLSKGSQLTRTNADARLPPGRAPTASHHPLLAARRSRPALDGTQGLLGGKDTLPILGRSYAPRDSPASGP